MSTGQTNINTSWLDEELRKKSALIEDLRDIIDKQQLAIADQAQRIAGLESRMTKMQAQVGQVSEVQEAVQHTRDELVLQISDVRQDIQKRDAEMTRSRQAERERDMRAVGDIVAELDRFTPLEQAIPTVKMETQRQNEVIMRLQEECRIIAPAAGRRHVRGERIEKVVVRPPTEGCRTREGCRDARHSACSSRGLAKRSRWAVSSRRPLRSPSTRGAPKSPGDAPVPRP